MTTQGQAAPETPPGVPPPQASVAVVPASLPPLAEKGLDTYLGYLSKEMTIMGVLASFFIAALGLFAQQVMGAPPATGLADVWIKGSFSVMTASCACVLAAASFNWQRSRLVGYYGHLSYALVQGDWSELWEKLAESDRRAVWLPYRLGIVFAWTALSQYGLALDRTRVGDARFIRAQEGVWTVVIPFGIALVWMGSFELWCRYAGRRARR